jgi:hypothetical protein
MSFYAENVRMCNLILISHLNFVGSGDVTPDSKHFIV